MTDKTETLLRTEIPVDKLVPNERNPNKMSSREFDLLVDNIQKVGFTDPVLVRPLQDDMYRIIGGYHRWQAAKYLNRKTVPCTVITDPAFDEEAEEMQLVRHNVIHGRMDPTMFYKLAERYMGKYGDDVLQEMFGFAEEAEFKKLIEKTAKSLPPEMQEKFKEAAAEIKTVDGLAKLLNHMFTMYGDTLPYGYMVMDYGGQLSVWLRVTKPTITAVYALGDVCRDNSRTLDDLIGGLVRKLAAGEYPEIMQELIDDSPEVQMPKNPILPTKDAVATQAAM